ncbi:MAG: DUF1801 domain-containing protein [Candidatus Kapaibacterium sp.]
MKQGFKNVDEYIEMFPENVREGMNMLRNIIKKNALKAEEGISYGMPAYKTNNRPLVYFAGFDKHIGFYALPTGHEKFKKELSLYKHGKGSVQFPLDKPLPLELIERMVKFRVKENEIRGKN